MCGIVGYLSLENKSVTARSKYFRQALFADTVRGRDSTGVFALQSKLDEITVFKKAVEAVDYLEMRQFLEIEAAGAKTPLMIGHNRWATQGGLGSAQAHPFTDGHITMVHNGTLYNHQDLVDGRNYDVDSEAICHSLAVDGVKKTVENLDGAFTLVWYDSKEHELRIIRNKERPFAIGEVVGEKTLLMASEEDMLKWIAKRNKFQLSKVYTPAVGVLHRWKIAEDTDLSKPVTEKYDVETISNKWTGYYGNSNWYNGGKNTGKKSQAISTVVGTKGDIQNITTTGGETFKIGDEIAMLCTGFTAYQKYRTDKPDNQIGFLDFFIDDTSDANFTARLHNVQISEWKDEMYSNVYFGRIKSFIGSGKGYVCTLKNDLTYMSIKDYYDVESTEELGITNTYKAMGKELTYTEFKEAAKNGCQICGSDIWHEDSDKTAWSEDGEPMCKDCVKDLGYQNLV